MSAPQTQTDPKAELRLLINEARRLRDDFETGFEQYKTNSQWNRVLGAIGVEAAYEYYNIPKQISRDGLKAFLKQWEATPQYRELRQRFESMVQRVQEYLSTVSESVASLRPPGNSGKLLAKLKPVREAVRLDTKMRRLLAVLEDIEDRNLVFNKDVPSPKP